MNEKRNRQLHLVVTPSEYDKIKSDYLANNYQSLTHYIMSALNEFSSVNYSKQVKAGKELGILFNTFNNELAHISGNLNQLLHHLNTIALNRNVNSADIDEHLIGTVNNINSLISLIRNDIITLLRFCSL